MKRFEETLTIVETICMCILTHGVKMHVESHAVTQGVVGVVTRLWREQKSRNRKYPSCHEAIETGLASRPAHRRLSHFTLVSGYH
jgi:hypothetical protein